MYGRIQGSVNALGYEGLEKYGKVRYLTVYGSSPVHSCKIFLSVLRIRIRLLTSFRIRTRIRIFTLMRIWIRISLLIKGDSNLRPTTVLQTHHSLMLSRHATFANVHGPPWLHFQPPRRHCERPRLRFEPLRLILRIRICLLKMMRMRIHLTKMNRIHTNPVLDPQVLS
jgi:hypothetical protein